MSVARRINDCDSFKRKIVCHGGVAALSSVEIFDPVTKMVEDCSLPSAVEFGTEAIAMSQRFLHRWSKCFQTINQVLAFASTSQWTTKANMPTEAWS